MVFLILRRVSSPRLPWVCSNRLFPGVAADSIPASAAAVSMPASAAVSIPGSAAEKIGESATRSLGISLLILGEPHCLLDGRKGVGGVRGDDCSEKLTTLAKLFYLMVLWPMCPWKRSQLTALFVAALTNVKDFYLSAKVEKIINTYNNLFVFQYRCLAM